MCLCAAPQSGLDSAAKVGRLIRPKCQVGKNIIKQPTDLASWAASFRLAAQADANSILRRHLGKFDLQVDPELLLEGTIEFVVACVALGNMDGRSLDGFLDLQRYDPTEAVGATYAVTFNMFGKGFARVITGGDLNSLDFADLYAMPWERCKLVGYECFWVSRTDGTDLSPVDLDLLEREVTDDLRFDYREDELDFWFDRDTHAGALLVSLQDHIEIDA